MTRISRERHDVGEVVLPLRVIGLKLRQQIGEDPRVGCDDARVAQIDHALPFAGVARLDDPQERAIFTRHHAAIEAWIGEPHANDHDRRIWRAAQRREGCCERRRLDQRAIAVDDQNVAADPLERLDGKPRRVAGSASLALDHRHDCKTRARRSRRIDHFLHSRPDDEH